MDLSHVQKDPLVLYHGGCRDGFCAAFLAKLRWPDVEMVPQAYGDPVFFTDSGEWIRVRVGGEERELRVRGRDVFVLDFSYPRPVLEGLRERARSLLVLDHHAHAKEALAGLDCCVFDEARSGCGLALDFFFPGSRERHQDVEEGRQERREVPGTMSGGGAPTWLVNLALFCEDWDTWAFKRGGTREVCAFIDTVPRTVEDWLRLPCPADMRERGAAVLAYQRQQVERILRHRYEVEWPLGVGPWNTAEHPGACRLTAVNTPILQSEVGEWIYRNATNAMKAALVWHQDERGDFVVSLRSAEDGVDVGEMAKAFGGGGHRHSAGFKIRRDEADRASFFVRQPAHRAGNCVL